MNSSGGTNKTCSLYAFIVGAKCPEIVKDEALSFFAAESSLIASTS